MAGLGAAIGGFAEGYAKGVRLKSEMEDSEQRRGLQNLQQQAAQIQVDNEKAMQVLGKQIGDEVTSFANMPNKDDPDLFDAHYSKLGGLLKQQAVLARKDPLEVDKSIQGMRKERFAERVFQGTQLLKTGDVDGGMAVLQPVYNKIFRDGNTVGGATYDSDKDAINFTFTRKDGTEGTRSVPRLEFANNIAPLALNVADAVKLDYQTRESEKERSFKGGENAKDRTSREGISASDNASAEKRTGISANATLQAARLGLESRREVRGEQNALAALNDFEKDLDNAMGISNRNSGIPMSSEERGLANSSRSMGRVAFDKTYEVLGSKLTGPQFIDLMEAHRAGKTSIKDDPQSGLRGIEYGGVRAVVPISSGIFAPAKPQQPAK